MNLDDFETARQFGPFNCLADARSYINMAKFPFVVSSALPGCYANYNLYICGKPSRANLFDELEPQDPHNIWITELKPKDNNDPTCNHPSDS